MILAATLGLALGLGLLSGGSLRILRGLTISGEVALSALLVLQLLAPLFAARLGLPKIVTLSLWCATLAAAASICIWNCGLRGMWLAATGLLFNAVVVLANLGMPVDATAYSRWTTGGSPLVLAAVDHLHVLLNPASRFAFLADVLAFPGPRPMASLVSAGDVLLLVGVAVLLSSGVVGEQRLARRGESPPHARSATGLEDSLQEINSQRRR